MEPDIITKCRLRGEKVYTKEGTYNPIKNASIESEEEPEEEEHQISSWARLHKLGYP
jgi:hypothetical protein